ncbi:MAG: hypothetical protein V4722_08650 [Bacteroidota bacterium]
MRKIQFYLIVFIVLSVTLACNGNRTSVKMLLKQTDLVILRRFTGKDTMKYAINDQKGIEVFTEIVNCKQQSISQGKKWGEVVYISNGKTLLAADMMSASISYPYDGKIYREKITYRAGMYFSEVWNQPSR